MPRLATLAALLALSSLSFAPLQSHGENKIVVKQKSLSSTCSNIVALAGDVKLNCSTLTLAQQKLLESIPSLLRRILQDQPNAAELSKKLDQVLAELAQPAQTVSAPNGIAILGNNMGNPTVNNFGPPLADITYTEETLTTPPIVDGKKDMKLHIHTDRSIPGAVIGVVMSGPFTLTKEYYAAHNPMQEGASSSQVNIRAPLAQGGLPIPNSFALIISIPSAFNPGVDLVVPVQALGDYHVLRVEQVTQ